MKDEPEDKTKLGLISLWLLLLLILLGGIQNAFSYSDYNLDISNVVFPSACYFRSEPVEQPRRTGQTGQGDQENIEEKGTPRDESLEPIILKYSEQYSVRASLVRCIIFKESSNNANAVGSAGEQGRAQFLPSTWRSFRKQMGESQEVSPFNPEEAVKTLSWGIANGYAHHWTTYRRCL